MIFSPHSRLPRSSVLPKFAAFAVGVLAGLCTQAMASPEPNAAATQLPAQTPVPVAQQAAFSPSGVVEAGAGGSALSNHFGRWYGQYLKGEYQSDPQNRWSGEFWNQKEFGDSGIYGAIGNTHVFNDEWFSSVNIGSSSGGFFLPRYRVDAFINKKWLEQKQLITTLGVGVYKATDVHRDESLFLGGTYYFNSPWIVQGGVRFNTSNPGSVHSTSQFLAVTQGRDKQRFVTLRYGFGEEAYQIVGAGQNLSEFHSQIISLELKQWFRDDMGMTVHTERYFSPNYDRNGVLVGLFKEF